MQIQQHSRLVARGKYIHGFEGTRTHLLSPRYLHLTQTRTHSHIVHRVKPDAVEEYKKAA